MPGYEHASLVALGTGDRRPRDAPCLRRLPADPRRRPGRTALRRRDRPVRRPDRGSPRRRRRRTRPGSTCRTAPRSASRIGPSWSATRRTCWSPDAASRRRTTPTPRSVRWPSAWRWARPPARRRRWRSRPDSTRVTSRSTRSATGSGSDGAILELPTSPGGSRDDLRPDRARRHRPERARRHLRPRARRHRWRPAGPHGA